MSRATVLIVVLLASLASFFAFGVSSAQADIGQDVGGLQDIQHLDWVVEPGVLDGVETAAVADSIAGSAGILAMGPIGLAAGGFLIIQAVWDSGLGSDIGTWLANVTPLYTTGYITNEEFCPYVQTVMGGTYGDATVNLPPGDSSSCGPSAAGFRTVAVGNKAPPFSQQDEHAPGFNTDVQNYYMLQYEGNCTNVTNTGMFSLTGNAGDQFSMLIDTNGSVMPGADHSSRQWNCMNDAFTLYTLGPSAGEANQITDSQVIVDNSSCVLIGTGSGLCGGGRTCAQEAVLEMAGTAPTYTGPCFFPVETENGMLHMLGGLTLKPCGLSGQITCAANDAAQNHIGTPTNCSVSGCAAALNKILAGGPATTTPDTPSVLQEVECFFNGTCPQRNLPIPIPKPQITETYDQYIVRLRRLGFWGHIFTVDDDMAYPSGSPGYLLSPGQMTEVQVGTNPAQPIYWPVPGHRLSGAPLPSGQDNPGDYYEPGWKTQSIKPSTDDITILKVPDSYDVGGPTGGGGGPCNCPGLNFNPLTNLNYGHKFPFGAFALMSTTLGTINGDTTGTPVEIHLGANAVMSEHTYVLSSAEWEDTYRPIIFPILKFMMTLMVIFFALRLLRHPGGDEEGAGGDA